MLFQCVCVCVCVCVRARNKVDAVITSLHTLRLLLQLNIDAPFEALIDFGTTFEKNQYLDGFSVTHTHARTHARTHTRTHTHTHTNTRARTNASMHPGICMRQCKHKLDQC